MAHADAVGRTCDAVRKAISHSVPRGNGLTDHGYLQRQSSRRRLEAQLTFFICSLENRVAVTPRDTRAKPSQHALLDAVVDALATYRLTVLVKDDKITERLRQAVFRRYGNLGDADVRNPSYLLGCPWCLSMYFGALAVACRRYAPATWKPLSRTLAFSAATGLLAQGVAGFHPNGHE